MQDDGTFQCNQCNTALNCNDRICWRYGSDKVYPVAVAEVVRDEIIIAEDMDPIIAKLAEWKGKL